MKTLTNYKKISEDQKNRMLDTFKQIAKEDIVLDIVDSDKYYVYGSELAIFRMFKAYKDKAVVGYSDNLDTWFFTID